MKKILKINSLCKSYKHPDKQPLEILNGLNLTLNKGESIGIMGSSGSGKSTLLSMIAGLDHVDDGEIYIEETNICTLKESALDEFRAQKIGIIFQQFHLLDHLSAVENVSLPLALRSDPQAREKSEATLEKVGLSDRMNHLPSRLSGGECQRVALARALVLEPTLLLADEPTGNLDSHSSQKTWQLMHELIDSSGMALVLVTHNEELASMCSRMARLTLGKLDESPAKAHI